MKNKKSIFLLIFTLLLVALTIYNIANYVSRTNNNISSPKANLKINSDLSIEVIKNIITENYSEIDISNKNLFIFINRKNFECSSCYKNFINVVEILNSKFQNKRTEVIVLFPENKLEGDFQHTKLRKWMENHDLNYQFLIIENKFLNLNDKETSVTLGKDNLIESDIPMTDRDFQKLEEILKKISL